MEEKDRNELIELFGKIFGESIVKEIKKYEKKHNEEEAENYSDDLKAIKKIVDNAVDEICRYIGPENGLMFEKLDKIIDLLESIRISQATKIETTGPDTIQPNKPWTTPYVPYPYYPNEPLNPLGPVITYCGPTCDRTIFSNPVHTYSVAGNTDSVNLTVKL